MRSNECLLVVRAALRPSTSIHTSDARPCLFRQSTQGSAVDSVHWR